MITRATWKEFGDAGLLWWVNRILHLFGWAIVFQMESDGTVTEVYPAKCKFRGFDEKSEDEGFKKLTRHIEAQLPEMIETIEEDEKPSEGVA